MSQDTNALGTARVSKLFYKLVIPTVIAQLVNLAYNMIDRIYIGHIPNVGSLALTGIGVCMPAITLLAAFAQLIGAGGAPRASFFLGQQDIKSAEHTLGSCTVCLFWFSILLTVIARIFSKNILLLFGASENTLSYALDYFNIYILGTIFVEFATGLVYFITAQGFTKISMLSVLVGAGLNIILDPVFIFIFHMGVKGAAIATVLSQASSAFVVLVFLSGKKSILKLYRENLHIHKHLILPALALGLSPCVMQITESILTISFNRSLLKYGGDIAVGTMTIFSTIMSIAVYPLMGIGQGAQPIISYNHGADRWDRVKKCCLLVLSISFCYSGILWILIQIFPQIFINIFANDPTLCSYARSMIHTFFAMLWIMGLQIAGQHLFLALGNARTSLFIALLRKVFLLVPLILLLPRILSNPVQAVFLAEPVSDTLAAVTTISLFGVQYKKNFTIKSCGGK